LVHHGSLEEALEARNKLVAHNLGLVYQTASKYTQRGARRGDLAQAGIIGLVRAAEKFDYRQGNRFSTYAVWWIRQAVDRERMDTAKLMRVPIVRWGQARKGRQARRELEEELGRTPTDEEVAERAGLSVRVLLEATEAIRRDVTSLDLQVGAKKDGRLGDLLPADTAHPDEGLEEANTRVQVDGALTTLPERWATVLRFRFGLDDDEPRSLDWIGQRLGVSRERVRQLQNKAIDQLREEGLLDALA